MKKTLYQLKSIALLTALMLACIFTAYAQNKTKLLGNRPRSGSANSSFAVVKGNQTGIKINVGHKPVQLLQLNFDAESMSSDSLKFKVNVYEFSYIAPGANLVKQPIVSALSKGKNRISVNLEPYNIIVKGHILVAIEWLKSSSAENHFAIGLFNGGTYCYEDGRWKKIPVAGVDFNVRVKKI
ncbi:MAG: hypothetical protein JWQ63_4267 [Mucilaginibacter sp.]|jgi:hypothetical protein|nr:hypothetical protein [Mucilaginibacter sp.]